MKLDVTTNNFDDALLYPEDYHWGPSTTDERPTQGGGTAVWDQSLNNYVFKQTPVWWTECKPGDPVPSEWGLL